MCTRNECEDDSPRSTMGHGYLIEEALLRHIQPIDALLRWSYKYCTYSISRTQFLKRLSQDDQYIRINLQQDGLWRGSRKVLQSHNRPTEYRRIYMCQNVSTERERVHLSKASYGFSLTRGWLPPSTVYISFLQYPSR
jgi:hypothetical protein